MLMIMSRTTLSQMAFLTSVVNSIRGSNYESPTGSKYVAIADLKEFITTKLGFTIETYDAQWTYRTNFDAAPPTINRVKFLPEGRVIIVPKQEISKIGYMGTTFHKDGSGQFKSGKYSWLKEDDEPPFLTRMGIGIVAWPVMEFGDSVWNLNAYA